MGIRLRDKLIKILNYLLSRNLYVVKIIHRIKRGFSLVELLIALAVIAILAAFAIPAYQDYLQRARFSESLIFAQQTLAQVYDYQQQHGVFPDNNSQLGIESAVEDSEVSQIVVGAGGHVCAVFNGEHLSGVVMLIPSLSGGNTIVVDNNLGKYAPNNALTIPTQIIPCESVVAIPSPTPTPSITVAASPTPAPSASAAATPVPSPSPSPNPEPVRSNYSSWWQWYLAYLLWSLLN